MGKQKIEIIELILSMAVPLITIRPSARDRYEERKISLNLNYRHFFMDRLARNTDLIGPAMCKGADINLGAGGRNIRKQASKNLYIAVGGASTHILFRRLLLARGIFSLCSLVNQIFFLESEQVFIHESGMTM